MVDELEKKINEGTIIDMGEVRYVAYLVSSNNQIIVTKNLGRVYIGIPTNGQPDIYSIPGISTSMFDGMDRKNNEPFIKKITELKGEPIQYRN